MTLSLIDILIGFFTVNALPHFLVGVTDVRFLSLFGFGNLQNILYSLLSLTTGIALYAYKYGASSILSNGILIGCLAVIIGYFFGAKFLYLRWKK